MWEAAVKSTKGHLKRTLGNNSLNYEELSTLLIQIESILNSRPLSPLSTDPSDPTALTPGHFLIGRSLNSIPEKDYTQVPSGRLSRFEYIAQLRQLFWNRWRKEYFSQLQERAKWRKEFPHSRLETSW